MGDLFTGRALPHELPTGSIDRENGELLNVGRLDAHLQAQAPEQASKQPAGAR